MNITSVKGHEALARLPGSFDLPVQVVANPLCVSSWHSRRYPQTAALIGYRSQLDANLSLSYLLRSRTERQIEQGWLGRKGLILVQSGCGGGGHGE